MKKVFLALSCLLALTATAQNPYDRYYEGLPIEIERVQPVVFPDTTVNLKVYLKRFAYNPQAGGLCTEIIQTAIDELSAAGGGHLVIPRGTWETGPLTLKSGVDLHLSKGSKILLTSDRTQYIKPDKKGNIPTKCVPGIVAKNVTNVGITGEGVIDGQGQYWRPVKEKKLFKNNDSEEDHESWERLTSLGGQYTQDDKTYRIWFPFHIKDFQGNDIPDICATAKEQEAMRNNLVDITGGENIIISDVTITNSPKFHLVPRQIHNLIIDGVQISCPWWAQNGDAMDIGNCRTVLVTRCNLSCGDDGLCMKAGVGQKGRDLGPNSDFLLRYDTVYRAHGGFVIGSEFSGDMQKMVVCDCLFDGTDIGLRFKSAPGRGGVTRDIYCQNIVMRNIREDAIFFEGGYADKRAGGGSATAGDQQDAFFPDWGNIIFSNITAVSVRSHVVNATGAALPVHDMLFRDIQVYGVGAEPLKLEKCERFTFTGCSWTGPGAAKSNLLKACSDITLDGQKIDK